MAAPWDTFIKKNFSHNYKKTLLTNVKKNLFRKYSCALGHSFIKKLSQNHKKSFFFFLQSTRMNTKNINKNIKSKNGDFYKNKKVFQIDDIDVKKILVSKKEPYDTKNALKYFIGYNDEVIRPLFVRLPQMNGYFKNFNENVTMSFKS